MILLKNSSRPLDAPKDSESNHRLRFALDPKLISYKAKLLLPNF